MFCNLLINKNIMDFTELYKWLIETWLYAFVWIWIMAISFLMLEKITNFSLKKELIEDENIALWIMFAGFFVAVAIIIAAAIT